MYFQSVVKKRLAVDQIEVEILSDGSCATCGGCGGSKCSTVVVDDSEHKIGDKITLELNSGYFWKSFLFVFVLPIVFLVLGLTINILLGFTLFFAAFGLAYWYDRRIAQRRLYKIFK